jgi:hypothetical protein
MPRILDAACASGAIASLGVSLFVDLAARAGMIEVGLAGHPTEDFSDEIIGGSEPTDDPFSAVLRGDAATGAAPGWSATGLGNPRCALGDRAPDHPDFSASMVGSVAADGLIHLDIAAHGTFPSASIVLREASLAVSGRAGGPAAP